MDEICYALMDRKLASDQFIAIRAAIEKPHEQP